MLELKQLAWFVRIAELGSMSRASVELNVAQPALSRQVRKMETALGQSLLIRTGRGVRVTEAGRVMVEHGRGILHQVTRLEEELGQVEQGVVGKVAIGMPPSISRSLTVPLSRALHQAMPDAGITLTEGLSLSMQESVMNGALDLALVFNPAPAPGLHLTPLGRYPLYVVSIPSESNAKSISLTRVAEMPLVIPSRPNVIRMELETRLAVQGMRPNIRFEVDTIPGLVDLVRDGLGVAVLPRVSIDAFGNSQDLLIRKIVKPEMALTLALIRSNRRPMTQVQTKAISLLEDLLQSKKP